MATLSTTSNTENSLADEFAKGSKVAFATIYDRYAPLLLGFVQRIVSDNHTAEELLKKSFVAMWTNRHTIGKRSLLPWLLQITKQTTTDYLTNNRTNDSLFDANGQSGKPVNFFELVYYRNYSLSEVAKILETDKTNLKSMLRNSINNLNTTA